MKERVVKEKRTLTGLGKCMHSLFLLTRSSDEQSTPMRHWTLHAQLFGMSLTRELHWSVGCS